MPRKVAFSGKQKKQQLLLKKQSKTVQTQNLIRNIKDETDTDTSAPTELEATSAVEQIQKINLQPNVDPRMKANRYVLQFHRETNKALKEMREEARNPIVALSEVDQEIGDDYYVGYDFPKRPKWNYRMSKEQLEAIENKYFFKYITLLEKTHYDDMKQLSYCELNIETWRQLWRVLEISDILLIIVDARYPTLMFPPALFDHIVKDLGKRMIMVLNKIDLVPAAIVLAWKKYFEEKYKTLHVLLFTSFPSYNLRGTQESNTGLKIRRRKGRQKMATEGAEQIFVACKDLVKDAVDLTSWEQKILEETNAVASNADDENDEVIAEKMHEEDTRFAFEEHELYKNGVLTIGCLGFPNVGKSSLMNALIGKKVVSVSRTPGHTKHFQTIFLTNTVRLCDCPGLVFPSSTPRRIQVLMGSYPIAQLREPYASIRFMAERIDLVSLLNIKHLEQRDHKEAVQPEFSAIDICDSWAVKRGFLTAKTGRPDTYRAANSLLRMALDGKLAICLRPKGFTFKKAEWESHPELEAIQKVQAIGRSGDKKVDYDYYSDSEDDESQAKLANDGALIFDPNTSGVTVESSDEGVGHSANPFSMLDDSEDSD